MNKNPERERENSQVLCEINMDWMRKMISNLYKIKLGEDIRKRKLWRECNGKVKSSGEIKTQTGRGKIGESITVDVD